MCKFQVTVSAETQHDSDRAWAKLKRLPHVTEIDEKGKEIFATVDHPQNLAHIQAAAWAKDNFGYDPVLVPAVKMV